MNDVADETSVTIVDHDGVSVFRGIILAQVVRGGDAIEFLQHLRDRSRIVFSLALLKDPYFDVVRRIRYFVEGTDLSMYLGTRGRRGICRKYKFLRDAVDFAFRQLLVPRSLATRARCRDNSDHYSNFQYGGYARR